jgi:hypothetical protein
MSIEGFFDITISLWRDRKKTTPTIKKEMKEVIRQFEMALDNGEIPKDREEDLKRTFKNIYWEINN